MYVTSAETTAEVVLLLTTWIKLLYAWTCLFVVLIFCYKSVTIYSLLDPPTSTHVPLLWSSFLWRKQLFVTQEIQEKSRETCKKQQKSSSPGQTFADVTFGIIMSNALRRLFHFNSALLKFPENQSICVVDYQLLFW